jgi:hypothetical protein
MKKKVKPPIKPNPIAFNFDEKEFEKGEREFRNKLINCMR